MSFSDETEKIRTVVALLRITLGIILLATWWDNLGKGLYSAEGLTDFFSWLFDAESGNGSRLHGYKQLLDGTILRLPALFAGFQLVAELLLGLLLLFGLFTPLAGAAAAFFFANLFLAYFGGHEWIWTYVLLIITALVAALSRSGRTRLGLDRLILARKGEPPYPFLW